MFIQEQNSFVVHGQGNTSKAFAYSLLVHLVFIIFVSLSFRWPWQNHSASERIIRAVVIDQKELPAKRPRVAKPEPVKEKSVKKKLKEKKKDSKAEAAKRKKAAEQALRELLLQEEQDRAAAVKQKKAASLILKYREVIRQKVSRNWVRPVGVKRNLECTVLVRLVSGGDVLEAKIVRSSGQPVFDRSVVNAVYKASPLPVPREAEWFEYFRELEFIFRPEQ